MLDFFYELWYYILAFEFTWSLQVGLVPKKFDIEAGGPLRFKRMNI